MIISTQNNTKAIKAEAKAIRSRNKAELQSLRIQSKKELQKEKINKMFTKAIKSTQVLKKQPQATYKIPIQEPAKYESKFYKDNYHNERQRLFYK